MASYPTKYEEDNFSEWKVQFEDEFYQFHNLLKREFKGSEPAKRSLKEFQKSFDNLMLILSESKEKMKRHDLNQRILVFMKSLNTIEQLTKEKMCATPLKQALEQLKSIFCDIVNYLFAGFPLTMTVEFVHLYSRKPSDYSKPLKPLSKRAQISRFFLHRLQEELPGAEKQTALSLVSLTP